MPPKKPKRNPKTPPERSPCKGASGSCTRPNSSPRRSSGNLARKFPVVTNVRQASVTDEIGIVCLELSGRRPDIKAAIKWLEELGIKVEPVEIGVIES